MEIPVINRFRGLDSGMTSLPNPALIPQILGSRSGFETISQSLDLWKWSAVIIAVVATFTGVINRIKLLFLVFRRQKRILQDIVDGSDSDGDFSVDDSASSVSSWSEFEEEDDADEPETSSSRSLDLTDRNFMVRGSDYYLNDSGTKQTLRLRHRRSFNTHDGDGNGSNQFSWADLRCGKSVVKLWDNLRFESDVYDVIKEQKIGSLVAGKSAVLLSATAGLSGGASINLWDTRVGSQTPALIAEWKPVAGKITVGDVRNVKAPLQNLTAADAETWFDADAVMVTAE